MVNITMYILLVLYGLLIFPDNIGSGAFDISLSLCFIFLIYRGNIDWKDFFSNKIVLFFLLLMGWLLATNWYNTDFPTTVYFLRKWPMRAFFTVFIFYHLAKSSRKNDQRILMILFYIVAVIAVSGGLFDFVSRTFWANPQLRLTSWGVHHAHAATFYNIIAVPLLCLTVFSKNIKSLLFNGTLFSATCFALYFTRTRSPIAAVSVGVLLFLGAIAVKNFNWKTVGTGITFVLVIGTVIFFAPGSEATIERFANTDLSYMTGRRIYYPHLFELVKEKPIVGYGFSTYRDKIIERTGNRRQRTPDSYILDLQYSGGIIAVILFVIFCFFFLRDPLKNYFKEANPNYLYLSIAISFFTYVFINGIIKSLDFHWVGLIMGFYFLFRNIGNSDQKGIYSLIS